MRTNPLRFHPDPDTLGGGGSKVERRNTGAATTGTSGSHRANPRRGDGTGGQAQQSNDDLDRRKGELRQDVMPDLDQPDDDTPNPT
jgi:hypothetical protein